MNSANNQENQEGTSVSLQLSATDREGTPTYSASGLPPGLTISGTGLISGSIGIGSFGSSPYQVTVTATDGSYTSSVSFVWTVTPRVALVNPGDQGNAEGDTVSLQLSATSPGGAMSYSASGLPSGLGINSSTGLISGMLSSGDSSNSPYTVTVTANDGASSSSQTFAWNVSVINLVAPGDQTNNDGDTVSLPLTTGYHGSGTLSYSATGLPPGLSINSSTGQITGKITGTADTSSPYSVTVNVTDGTNTSSQSFAWAINTVVSVNSLDDQSNAAGDAVSLQVAASDALNNTLTYSATNLPAGLSINSTNSGLTSHQAFQVELGDTARATYGEHEVSNTVPVQNVVNLDIWILRMAKRGRQVITEPRVKADVDSANAVYAPLGIQFKILGNVTGVRNPPAGVNLSNGLESLLNDPKNDIRGNKLTLTAEEKSLLDATEPIGPDNKKYILVLYVNYLAKDGVDNRYSGEALPAALVPARKYADTTIISANHDAYTVLRRKREEKGTTYFCDIHSGKCTLSSFPFRSAAEGAWENNVHFNIED